jgi:hypothetical protein
MEALLHTIIHVEALLTSWYPLSMADFSSEVHPMYIRGGLFQKIQKLCGEIVDTSFEIPEQSAEEYFETDCTPDVELHVVEEY